LLALRFEGIPPFGGSGADLGDGRPAFVEDEALEVVGEVR